MKFFFTIALLVVAAAAAPLDNDKDAVILSYNSDNIGVDGFQYAVETSNGIKDKAVGVLKNAGSENEALEIQGSYGYTGPDGVIYEVTYVSNEFGFQPSGAHLPRA